MSIDVMILPAINAALNTLAAVSMLVGWGLIRQRRRDAHRNAMLLAVGFSALFLVSYLIYHAQVGSRPFTGTGPVRVVYFFILITHVVLAAAIVPLVLVTVGRALRGRYERHRAIARWTLPLWLYVSITGVTVYVMLY